MRLIFASDGFEGLTGVQIHGGEQGFERVRRDGGAFPSAVHHFAVPEMHVLPEPDLRRVLRQRLFADHRRADLRQIPFLLVPEPLEEIGTDNDGQNGVPEKFQPFVVGRAAPLGLHFVVVGRVGQRFRQQIPVPKRVPDLLFQLRRRTRFEPNVVPFHFVYSPVLSAGLMSAAFLAALSSP